MASGDAFLPGGSSLVSLYWSSPTPLDFVPRVDEELGLTGAKARVSVFHRAARLATKNLDLSAVADFEEQAVVREIGVEIACLLVRITKPHHPL